MVVRSTLLLILYFFPFITFGASTIDVSYYKSGGQLSSQRMDVWQRELITINIDIQTINEFSYLKETIFSIDGYIIDTKVMPATTLLNEKKFQKRLRIFIWPLQAGTHAVEFPDIDLWLSGRVINSFKLESLNLTVKPLPDYLPPGFPVGIISHEDNFSSDGLFFNTLRPDHLSYYQLKTNTSGIHPSMLADYSTYLKSPAISRLAVSEVTESFQYDLAYNYSSSQLIPVLPKASGIYSFNEFKVLFFNSKQGKVNSYQFDGDFAVVLNIIFQLIAVFALCGLLIYLLYRLKYLAVNICSRRRLWKQIKQSNELIELTELIRQLQPSFSPFSTDIRGHVNLSLSQWAEDWRDAQLSTYADDLNRQIFSDPQCRSSADNQSNIVLRLVALDSWIYTIFT